MNLRASRHTDTRCALILSSGSTGAGRARALKNKPAAPALWRGPAPCFLFGLARRGALKLARTAALAPLLAAAIAAALAAAAPQAALAADGGEGRLAVLDTGSGRIVIEFFADDAPNHVDNFASLAESGFYDGTVFHRVIPGFMIQGGDPNTRQDDPAPRSAWGTGGPGTTVDAEFNDIRHDRGIVSMARSAAPDSAGSQFFIVHSNSNFLDGQYTAFGRVVTADSLETLDAIAALPTDGRDAPERIDAAAVRSVTIVDRGSVDGVEDLGDPARISAPAGPPPGAPPPVGIPDSGTYTNDEFGISFDVPDGWLLQLTGETGEFFPDLAMLKPAPMGGQPQAITIAVDPLGNSTFEAMLKDHAATIQEAVDGGQLVIESKTAVTVNGVVAQQTDARSDLEFVGENVSVRFREVVVAGTDDFYTITYSSLAGQFADSEDDFAAVISSFSAAGVGRPAEAAAGGGGCLIATAAYGTEMAPQVQLLREVRDGALARTAAGSAAVGTLSAAYYAFSPAAADAVRDHPVAADAVRAYIAPLLSILSIASLADGQTGWQAVALASLAAALAVGTYVAAPVAAAALAARRWRASRRG